MNSWFRPFYIIKITALLFLNAANAQIKMHAVDSLPSRQLLIVITRGWDNVEGTLYAYNKLHGRWVLQFSNPVVVGGKGLGLGNGVQTLIINDVPLKHEGDMKSPAGIFSIGTAFGYAEYNEASFIANRYIRCTDTLICVDDIHSVNYNKLVRNDTAAKDYNSHEDMLLKKAYYKWGLVINYNTDARIPGNGSCIFMHIWGNEHEGTAGCTAMSEGDMVRVLHFIQRPLNPLLVQFPGEIYEKIAALYDLPQISFHQ